MECISQKRCGNLWRSESRPSAWSASLIGRFEVNKPKAAEQEDEEDVTKVIGVGPLERADGKIYYTSRTHTQLRQLTTELLKTSFPHSESDEGKLTAEAAGVSLVPLGSRKQLCINEKVRALAKGGNDERMNEACLDMQKTGELCSPLPHSIDGVDV
jgi:chromosome transmission fidelity protein 1